MPWRPQLDDDLEYAWKDDFADVALWTFAFQCTKTADPAVSLYGTQSVRINPTAGTDCILRREFASPGLDLSAGGGSTTLAYGLTAVWNIGVFTGLTNVNLWAVDWSGNQGYFQFRNSATSVQNNFTGWHLSQEDRYSFIPVTGTMDWSRIRYLHFRPTYSTGYTGPLYFDRIGFFQLNRPKRVILCFDDGYDEHYDISQYAASKGVKASFAVITNFGAGAFNITAAQMAAMIATPGIEVVNHCHTFDTGADWLAGTTAQRVADVTTARDTINTAGGRGDILVTPAGELEAGDLEALLDAGVVTHIRTVRELRVNQNVDRRLSSVSSINGLTDAQTYISRAKTIGGTAVITFHELDGVGGNPTYAAVQGLIDSIATDQATGMLRSVHFGDYLETRPTRTASRQLTRAH